MLFPFLPLLFSFPPFSFSPLPQSTSPDNPSLSRSTLVQSLQFSALSLPPFVSPARTLFKRPPPSPSLLPSALTLDLILNMRSFAALSALAVPALALSYSHADPRSVKRHHQLAERAMEQRDQVAPSSGRMARKIKRGDGELLTLFLFTLSPPLFKKVNHNFGGLAAHSSTPS